MLCGGAAKWAQQFEARVPDDACDAQGGRSAQERAGAIWKQCGLRQFSQPPSTSFVAEEFILKAGNRGRTIPAEYRNRARMQVTQAGFQQIP